jgi:hypothetical protein
MRPGLSSRFDVTEIAIQGIKELLAGRNAA